MDLQNKQHTLVSSPVKSPLYTLIIVCCRVGKNQRYKRDEGIALSGEEGGGDKIINLRSGRGRSVYLAFRPTCFF